MVLSALVCRKRPTIPAAIQEVPPDMLIKTKNVQVISYRRLKDDEILKTHRDNSIQQKCVRQ